VFESEGTVYMVMELCTGGELWRFLKRVEFLPNGDKLYFSPQVPRHTKLISQKWF